MDFIGPYKVRNLFSGHKVTSKIFDILQSMQFHNIPDKLNEQKIPKKADNKQACHSKWNETGSSRAAAEHLDY